MAIVPSELPPEEIAKVEAIINAEIDLGQAYRLGFLDGEAGIDQNGFAYFKQFSPQWHEYNRGYEAGTRLYTQRTGKPRRCLIAGHRRLDIETIDALSPFAGAFQGEYKDVLPDYQRDDWIGM